MLGGITAAFMFTLPETLPSQVLLNKAKRIRKLKIPGYEDVKAPVEMTDRTLLGIFKVALLRPWQILIDPISFLVAIYLSVVYTLVYMLFTIYPIVFQQKRGWNSGVGELPLIGIVIGAWVGGAIVFYVSSRDKKAMIAGHKRVPEDRLPVAMAGGIGFAVFMFAFCWSAEFNYVHWIVPTIFGVLLSASIMLIFVAYLNYLTDTYLLYAASALAANTVIRSACAAASPLFTQYMFDALGVGGGGSLVGGVAALLAPIPFIFYKYGGAIRERSKFAPTPAKQDKQANQEAQVGGVRETSEEEEDERELDEEAGVPDPKELEHDIEKENGSKSSRIGSDDERYLDASGMEKAEA
jgi:DHA1 family multidrug resistance protein-like MFS transporter